jgi:hypothetical protein
MSDTGPTPYDSEYAVSPDSPDARKLQALIDREWDDLSGT